MNIENIYCVNCREKMQLTGIESNFHINESDTEERHYYACENCNTEICLEIR